MSFKLCGFHFEVWDVRSGRAISYSINFNKCIAVRKLTFLQLTNIL